VLKTGWQARESGPLARGHHSRAPKTHQYFVVIRGLHFQNVPISSYTEPAVEPPEYDSQVAEQNLNQTMSDRGVLMVISGKNLTR